MVEVSVVADSTRGTAVFAFVQKNKKPKFDDTGTKLSTFGTFLLFSWPTDVNLALLGVSMKLLTTTNHARIWTKSNKISYENMFDIHHLFAIFEVAFVLRILKYTR